MHRWCLWGRILPFTLAQSRTLVPCFISKSENIVSPLVLMVFFCAVDTDWEGMTKAFTLEYWPALSAGTFPGAFKGTRPAFTLDNTPTNVWLLSSVGKSNYSAGWTPFSSVMQWRVSLCHLSSKFHPSPFKQRSNIIPNDSALSLKETLK